jgi:AraC-like DNA-binding protein
MLDPGWGLLAVSFINILTGSVLFFRSRFEDLNPANRYLSAFFVIAGIFGLTFYSIWYSNETWPIVFLFGHAAPLYYLTGPLSWLYVRSILNDDYRLKRIDLLHFLPFTINIINLLPYYLLGLDDKIEIAELIINNPGEMVSLEISLFYPTYLNYIFRPLIGFTYASYSLWYVLKSFAPFKELPKYTVYLKAWLVAFIFSQIALFVALGLFYSTSQYEYNDTNRVDRESILLVVTGISYVLLSSTPLIFSNLLYGNVESFLGLRNNKASQHRNPSVSMNPVIAIQEGRIAGPVNPSRLEEIQVLINELLSDNPIYLQPDFSVGTLATHLDIPVYHLNFFFKYYRKQKFTDFKTELRIGYATQLLSKDLENRPVLSEVSRLCGYSNVESFVSDYKGITGQDPTLITETGLRN